MVGSSALLGAAFVALGTLVSALVRDRGTAAGIAVGLWLLMVLIWDMALLGLLVADRGETVTARAVDALLLLNPTDAYRLFNLAGLPGVGALSGMAGLAEDTGLTPPVLLAALAAWVLVPLAAAAAAFARREL
jgi:Cu-processing system permease protein